MTPADHANTVRPAITNAAGPSLREAALAALDALQAQAEAVEKRSIVTTTVQGDTYMNRLRERAEAAEARIEVLEIMDMTATAQQWEMGMKHWKQRAETAEAERDRLQKDVDWLKRTVDGFVDERDRLADALEKIDCFGQRNDIRRVARAALAGEDAR